MNWRGIIENGQLVYQSKENDIPFRNWSLKKTQCNVSYYETYPLDDIDRIICSIIYKHEGEIDESEIAAMLGFNVRNNFDVTPKRYADVAELHLFRSIVQPVFDWGLISKTIENSKIPECSTITYSLTELGKRAVERHLKYKFFSGKKILFEHYNINDVSDNDGKFFPYYEELGISSEITSKFKINYNKIDVSILDCIDSDLIKRMQLQSANHYNIYQADETIYYEIESEKVDFKIYLYNNVYYPLVFLQNELCEIATDILNNEANTNLKNNKIEWGLYLRLINDEKAKLDYETIIPFEDILVLDDLIIDKRLVWSDDRLFKFITKNTDANQVSAISFHCPVETIKKHIDEDDVQWDWIILSQRIDELFVAKNPQLNWDFGIISSRDDISINVIKSLLVNQQLQNVEWNWDNIMPQLDFNFIKQNIQNVDFDLYELCKSESEDVRELVSKNPSKRWDWAYISKEYDLGFILSSINNFIYLDQEGVQHNYLNLARVVERAFHSEQYVLAYCSSPDFKEVISKSTSSLSSYSANMADFLWSDSLIAFLESVGLLSWSSGLFTKGFECNPFVKWDEKYFQKYNSHISTERGFSFVSQTITDPKIVIGHSEFNWDWDILSCNEALIADEDFVKTFIKRLSLTSTLPRLDGTLIEDLFENLNLLELLSSDSNLWQIVTQKVSVEFVRKKLSYNWDWKILTRRFYTTININAIGNEKWINKWDWQFLTKNLDWNVVYDNVERYYEYWDWEYLTKQLDKDFVVSHLPEYLKFWNWKYLVDSRLDKSDLTLSTHLVPIATCILYLDDNLPSELWTIITQKFDYNELIALIHATNQTGENSALFKWDYEYLYSMSEFDIASYLDKYPEDVQWDLLSKSSRLNEYLKWDKSDFRSEQRWKKDVQKLLKDTDYLWDFAELSKLDSINSQIDILSIRTVEWDWQYLTANSKLFDNGRSFVDNFNRFKRYIDFQVLSERRNSGVNQRTIELNVEKNWNWIELSKNETIYFDIDFVRNYQDKPWDWLTLSARSDIKLDNESLFSLIDKDWDWSKISSCSTISFDEECIKKLLSKPVDWFAISQNKSFVPNQTTLSFLRGKNLDWDAISQNGNLDESVLWDNRDKLNWKYVTPNKINYADNHQLEKFSDFIDWHCVSLSDKFLLTFDNLLKFKSKIDWRVINQRDDFVITNEVLDDFADVIDWNNASRSRDIQFSEKLIEKYHSKWNWQILRQNPLVDKLSGALKKYVIELNCADFVDRFPQKPYIYHFTHLFNAIDIIKSRKIKSRNRAEGQFSNAAGNLVDRRSTAHNYARFYYRPQTPTQFYNECLGWDSYLRTSEGKSYYTQARNLGLPKCPMPVFFKFDLAEVVSKIPDLCYYSTGNMQTNWASVEKVSDNPNGLNTHDVYSTFRDGYEKYKQYSQQEFLVLDELDFSESQSFEIICYDEEQAQILKNQLKGDAIIDKITTNGDGVFHRNNRQIEMVDKGDTISISSDYRESAYFKIKTMDKQIVITTGTNVLKETKDTIIAYPAIEFSKNNNPVEVHFIDEINRDWIIYKN